MKWSPDVYNLEDHRLDTYNLITAAANISVPTLLIYSATSFIPQAEIKAFCAALPQGQLQLVENVGHNNNIYREQPDLIASMARAFQSRH